MRVLKFCELYRTFGSGEGTIQPCRVQLRKPARCILGMSWPHNPQPPGNIFPQHFLEGLSLMRYSMIINHLSTTHTENSWNLIRLVDVSETSKKSLKSLQNLNSQTFEIMGSLAVMWCKSRSVLCHVYTQLWSICILNGSMGYLLWVVPGRWCRHSIQVRYLLLLARARECCQGVNAKTAKVLESKDCDWGFASKEVLLCRGISPTVSVQRRSFWFWTI